MAKENNVILVNAGKLKYADAWQLQKKMFNHVSENKDVHYFLVTEHPPVITIGKNGGHENLLITRKDLDNKKIELYEIDRGGDITFHGPGQIVGYPILNLTNFKKDVHWYLRKLEEIIIKTLAVFGYVGEQHSGLTGVWIGSKKICAIGVKITRWITMHGFALNISTDLDYFQFIVPCGINDKGITSLSELNGTIFSFEDVYPVLLESFQSVFNCKMNSIDIEQIKQNLK